MRDTFAMAVSEQRLDEVIVAEADAFCRRVGASAFFAAGVPVAVARAPGLLASSTIPEGKGLGSSAALEVAVLQASSACLGARCEPRDLALLGQRAEQIFAGAPCGAMDQMAVMHGEAGRLLALLCRPAEIVASVTLPDALSAWAIDSGLPHAVSGAAYRRVRCAAFMGRALLDCEVDYLAELELADVDARRLPERMLGADFLRL